MEMFQKEPILYRSSAYVQALSLLLIIVLSLLFVYLFAMILALPFWGKDVLFMLDGGKLDLSQPEVISFMKYIQMVSQFAIFILPPVLFAFFVHRKIVDYLKLNSRFSFVQLLLSIFLIYVCLPFLSWIGTLNQQMVLPEFLAGVENWMKTTEAAASQQIMAFLNVKTFGAIFFNFIMIALIPGIGEELLFRGVLVRLFKKWFGNVHAAVIVSAILFSALHMQFYGFFPRFALGLILGYTFVWTSSLWVPIIIHFLNNATILMIYYINKTPDIMDQEIESIGASQNMYVIVASAVFSFIFLYLIYNQRKITEN